MSKKLVGVLGWSAVGIVAALVLLFVAGIGIGFLVGHGAITQDQAMLWVIAPFAVVCMVGSLWIGAAWMRSIDEAAREAHKAAWYWGGTGGMCVAGVFMILGVLPQAETIAWPGLYGRTDPAAYAISGAFALMCAMLVGYTVVWLWWWWRRR